MVLAEAVVGVGRELVGVTGLELAAGGLAAGQVA